MKPGDYTEGDTRVARWKFNKQAVFLLMFDDGAPTHLKYVIPELQKRDLVGLFFLNTHVKWYDKKFWEIEIPKTKMELGNHTMHHCGAKDSAQADAEIAGVQDILLKLYPERPVPRLIAFSYPGGSAWNVSNAEKAAMLKKYHLVNRPNPDGHIGGEHLKTGAEMIKLVDRALANGSLEHLSFHGVGGDWLPISLPDFLQLLDALAANREKIWNPDLVLAHKYETERDMAKVMVLDKQPSSIRLYLQATKDPLYDEPLTLITRVPAGWKQCNVKQGNRTVGVTTVKGEIQYEVLPDGPEIVIQPAT